MAQGSLALACHLFLIGGFCEAYACEQKALCWQVSPAGFSHEGCECRSWSDAWRYSAVTCYNPIPAFRTPDGVVFSELRRYDILGSIEIPCGQCIGCRLRRSREWSVRCLHEAQCWDTNCFVTLTYDDENLSSPSLIHGDFAKFMKRLRRHFKSRIRFFMCGEYGPSTLRPHYHALLFNCNFFDRRSRGKSSSGFPLYESALLSRLWGLGFATVQDLNPQTVGYCTRYIVDKVTGDAAEAHYEYVDECGEVKSRKPEYCACSLKPGIGALWYERYGDRVSAQDFVVVDGDKVPVPRYYDKLADRRKLVDLDAIEFARELRAKAAAPDSTPERLVVREIVHKARVRSLKREGN